MSNQCKFCNEPVSSIGGWKWNEHTACRKCHEELSELAEYDWDAINSAPRIFEAVICIIPIIAGLALIFWS